MDRNFTSQRLAHNMTNMNKGRGGGLWGENSTSEMDFNIRRWDAIRRMSFATKKLKLYRDRDKFPVLLLYMY